MSEPPAATSTGRNTAVALSMLGVLGVTVWLIGQGERFLANIAIIIEVLPALAALWLGAAGFGYPLRRALLPNVRHGIVAQTGLGLAALLLINWLLACFGALHMLSAWGLCAVGMALLAAQLVMAHRDGTLECATSSIALPWALPVAMPGLGVMLVAAACPPGTLWQMEAFGYDVLTYHLQLPREWLELGAMTGLEHNVYSYMPSLIEGAYMQLAAMQGGVYAAIYTCQLFHVSLACFAAVAVACAAVRFVNVTAAVLAAGALLALPWTVITGSLAYNEMAMLAFGGAALLILFDEAGETVRGGAAAGMLLGAATLAKLTAGLLLAAPIGVIALVGWHRALPWRPHVRVAAAMALAGTLMLAPYLVRNAVWTGNPVFPFATSVLGTGHWDEAQAARWERGHGVSWAEGNRGEALLKQWLLNTGYGAVGGAEVQRTAENIARFDREGGVPLLWLGVAASCAVALRRKEMRPIAAALGALIVLQLVAWLSVTHLQSRFLVPTLLPAVLLLALGLGALPRRWSMVGGVLVVVFALSSGVTLHQQSRAAVGLLIDAFVPPGRGRVPEGAVNSHPINGLPRDSRTYLVADNGSLLYLDRPIVYHTPFDASPLGAMVRAADGEPGAVNRLLRERGITHVWVNWGELERLHGTYGYDEDVTRGTLRGLMAGGWRRVWGGDGNVALYALPRE
ncbi:MAG: hypothetical protein ACODAQ_09085 [Phycisphaeraceae bacterium]